MFQYIVNIVLAMKNIAAQTLKNNRTMTIESLKGYTVDSIHSHLETAVQRKQHYVTMCGCNVKVVESINGFGFRVIVPNWAYLRVTGSTVVYPV